MIDLTPLDVRKKRGDFTKSLRGYDTQQVDSFLELVAERLEELVKENLTLTERVERLAEQVDAQTGREKAVNEALVTAQQLRDEIQTSAQREADLLVRECRNEIDEMMREATVDAERLRAEAEKESARLLNELERKIAEQHRVLQQLTRSRARFLGSYRQLLEREMDMVAVQEETEPLENAPIELDLLGGRSDDQGPVVSPESLAPDVEDADGVSGEDPDEEDADED